jgi:hypothetical protein
MDLYRHYILCLHGVHTNNFLLFLKLAFRQVGKHRA